jgi:hypothetical protein
MREAQRVIFYESLILSQLRKFAEIRAQSYSLNVYRPCSARIIILTPFSKFPFRKAVFLIFRRNITSTYRRHA